MADSSSTVSRMQLHQMLNVIKKAEIENAKTMARTDKEMVTLIANYIFREASMQKDAPASDGEEDDLE